MHATYVERGMILILCVLHTNIHSKGNSWVDNSIWKIPRYLTDKSECPAFGQRTTTSHPFVRSNEVFWSAMAIRDMLTFLIGFSPSISNPNSDDRTRALIRILFPKNPDADAASEWWWWSNKSFRVKTVKLVLNCHEAIQAVRPHFIISLIAIFLR